MSRLRFISVFAVLALIAVAAVPVVAQATQSHWYRGRSELTRGTRRAVDGTGKLTMHLLTGAQAGTEVKCDVSYQAEVWNPAPKGAGEDSINAVAFPKCNATPAFCSVTSKLPVHALGLPWHSTLYREPPREGDELEALQLEIACASGESSLIEGALAGPVGTGRSNQEGVLANSARTVEAEVDLFLELKKLTIGP